VPVHQPLATVSYQQNAVYYRGEAVGAQTIQGKGAGQMPTANAVLSDICNIAGGTIYPLPAFNRKRTVVPHESFELEYFLRFNALDRPGVLSRISGVLGRFDISIASVIQKGVGDYVPLMIKTHKALEGNVYQALKEIESVGATSEEGRLIRVLGE
jgi:homoserine dehydrogenase